MYNLVSTITQLPSMVGCQEFPNSPQGMALIKLIQDFINEEYKYSGETVRKAFMMAAKQELYLDGKRIDASTFGQHLSVNVVGRVLTAYKEHIRKGNARPTGYNPMQLPESKVKELTPAEAHDLILKWCKEDKKLPFVAPYLHAYKYLVDNNQIKEVATSTNANRFKRSEEDTRITLVKQWYTNNVLR